MRLEKHTEKILMIVVIVLLAGLTFFRYFTGDGEDLSKEIAPLSSDRNTVRQEDDDEIAVYITGEVNKPGVYEVEEGQRLDDLLEMAGGVSPKANLDAVNLAIRLVDEMKIIIPSIDASEQNFLSSSPKDERVDLNLASKEELMTLDGIGEKTADKIIDYRARSQFKTIEDLMKVSGIGQKTFDSIKEKIKVN